MTPQQAKELLPIITAFAEGKTIEIFDGLNKKQWVTVSQPTWATGNEYRIKPEPKLRPWKPEEVPVGALIRRKEHNNTRSIIIGLVDDYTQLAFIGGRANIMLDETFTDCLTLNEHSLDGGKTWLPCGIME